MKTAWLFAKNQLSQGHAILTHRLSGFWFFLFWIYLFGWILRYLSPRKTFCPFQQIMDLNILSHFYVPSNKVNTRGRKSHRTESYILLRDHTKTWMTPSFISFTGLTNNAYRGHLESNSKQQIIKTSLKLNSAVSFVNYICREEHLS